MTDDPATITIRALIAARGLTHPEVASTIGMALSTFERRLSKGGWSLEEGRRLARLLGVTLDELVTGLDGQLVREPERRDGDDA